MRLKTWLSLTLAVLLVHLALMQTLVPDLAEVQTPTGPMFTTRTMVLPPAPAPAATPTAPRKVKAKTPAARKPVAQPGLAPESVASPDGKAPLASLDAGATNAPAPTPVPAADPASAPERAAEPESTTVAAAPLSDANPPIPASELAFKADGLPASVKLMYRVEANKFPYTLSSELLWQLRDNNYQAQLSISSFGQTRVQSSRGQIDSLGLAPERFSDKYRSELAAHFNRAQGLVSFSANTPNLALQPGAQDRLSVLVQLAALVASDPKRFTPGTTLRVQTIGPRDGDLWLFTFGAMEALDLPGGPQQGLKLVRQPRQTYDQKLEVWLAPGLAYLPARIRITEANGDYVDQKWAASQAAESP